MNKISASEGAFCNTRNTSASPATCSRKPKQRADKLCTVSEVHLLIHYLPTDYLGTVNYLLALKNDGALKSPMESNCAIGLRIEVGIRSFLHQKFASKTRLKTSSGESMTDTRYFTQKSLEGPYDKKA